MFFTRTISSPHCVKLRQASPADPLSLDRFGPVYSRPRGFDGTALEGCYERPWLCVDWTGRVVSAANEERQPASPIAYRGCSRPIVSSALSLHRCPAARKENDRQNDTAFDEIHRSSLR